MARYTVPTLDGPKRRAVYGKTRKEAHDRLIRALAERDGGLAFEPSQVTFGEWLERWLKDSVLPSVKESTAMNYERMARNHVKPALGALKLVDLRAAHVRGFYQGKEATLAPKSMALLHTVVGGSLKDAVRLGLLPSSPIEHRVKAPRIEEKEMRVLDRDEARALLDAARGDRLYAMYALALSKGLRHGELLGLRWSDVDFGAGELRVRRQLVRGRPKREGGVGLAFTSLKRGPARVVSFEEEIDAILRRHKAQSTEERLAFGPGYVESEQVFTAEGGGVLAPWKSTRRFNTLKKRAGLGPETGMHTLRHTAATLALLEGVPARVVQEMLGHKNISETMDRYSHVLPTMQRSAAKRLEAALF